MTAVPINRGTDPLSQRVYALIFNGVSRGRLGFISLSEREQIAEAVYAELREGGLEIRIADGLEVLRDVNARLADGCTAETRSWDHFTPEQMDSYWIRCTLADPHDEHEDENTGLTWRTGGSTVTDQPDRRVVQCNYVEPTGVAVKGARAYVCRLNPGNSNVSVMTDLRNHPSPVRALYEHLSDISEDVYAASWMSDCEWGIWQAYADWQAGKPARWSFADITAHMPELDRLHREADGWIWWLNEPGPQFVPLERWLRLVAERERECVDNEGLALRVTG